MLVLTGCRTFVGDTDVRASADEDPPASAETSGGSHGNQWPLPDAALRPTPLHFGLFVTQDPDHNPINPPERFTGYHAATDFELLPGEENGDIPVFAICRGQVAFSGFAEGYGGLLIQRCRLKEEDVTVLYGHLKLDPLPAEGEMLKPGEQISLLADARSYESGWTRKHLHLGIHRGRRIDLRGYTQEQDDLKDYLDPQSILPL